MSCTPTPDAQLPVSGLLLAGPLASGLTHPVILSGFRPHPSQAQPRLAVDSPVLLLFKRAIGCKPTCTEAFLIHPPQRTRLLEPRPVSYPGLTSPWNSGSHICKAGSSPPPAWAETSLSPSVPPTAEAPDSAGAEGQACQPLGCGVRGPTPRAAPASQPVCTD